MKPRVERYFIMPQGRGIAALKGLPRWGGERHSEYSGRAFAGAGAACQRPGAKRSRKAFRDLLRNES
jgi:hypothetical protein